METVMAWAGFAGAWFLVAGPLYQGAIELQEEAVDQDEIEASVSELPRPKPPSPWWWLLPPMVYLIRRHRGRAYQRAALALLSQAQREQLATFLNKAAGWFTVAVGAFLLAAEQTWQVVHHYRWPSWVFWLMLVFMLISCLLNTALRMMRAEQMVRADQARKPRPQRRRSGAS